MTRSLLVDGSSQIYRAYHAMARGAGARLTAPDGTPTGALVAFLQVLRKAIRQHEPDRVAVSFDLRGPTFRNELFPEYKAQRDATPEELLLQIDLAREALASMGLRVVETEGYEADDVIATLARSAREAGDEVVILSSDKDLVQLVRDGVSLHHASRDAIYDMENAAEVLGVPPRQVPDLLAIMGDASDNIPGVPGIGAKGAQALLSRHADLEALLADPAKLAEDQELGRLRKRMASALAENADAARLARRLVVLVEDVPLEVSLDDLAIGHADHDRCRELFTRLGLVKLLEELGVDEEEAAPLRTLDRDAVDYRVVTASGLSELAATMRRAGRVALDTETDGRDPHRARLVGLSVVVEPARGFYVPVCHQEGECVPLDAVREHLGPVLADASVGKVGQNLKFDACVLARHGLPVEGVVFDTMIASYLLDSARRSHSLDQLAADLLSYRPISYDEVARRPDGAPAEGAPADGDAGPVTLDMVSIETVSAYCCEDADIALQLAELFAPRLEEAKLRTLFDEVEVPLVPVLAAMEAKGVRIDGAVLDELHVELEGRLEALTREIHGLAGRELNIASPQQLATVLFDELGLEPRGRTAKTGARSTAVDVLEQLAAEHPLPGLVLEHRELSKLNGTYIEPLPKLVNPETGRVHPSYNQSVAATGRLSCSDPNLQNIPVRTELGRRIRRAFVPAEGHRFVGADYSQVELRVMAHVSQDEALIAAFERGEDIHAATARKMFGVGPGGVTPELRAKAKEVNFGVLYGMTAHGLAQRLRISRGEAKKIIDAYFAAHPGVAATVERLIALCRDSEHHEARTLWGRVRRLPEIVSRNGARRGFAERAAVNTVIQGTAADLIKLAMIHLHARLRQEAPSSSIILQVHDELVVEAPEDDAERVLSLVEESMAGVADFRVPLEARGAVGNSWYDLK